MTSTQGTHICLWIKESESSAEASSPAIYSICPDEQHTSRLYCPPLTSGSKATRDSSYTDKDGVPHSTALTANKLLFQPWSKKEKKKAICILYLYQHVAKQSCCPNLHARHQVALHYFLQNKNLWKLQSSSMLSSSIPCAKINQKL